MLISMMGRRRFGAGWITLAAAVVICALVASSILLIPWKACPGCGGRGTLPARYPLTGRECDFCLGRGRVNLLGPAIVCPECSGFSRGSTLRLMEFQERSSDPSYLGMSTSELRNPCARCESRGFVNLIGIRLRRGSWRPGQDYWSAESP